jgi:UPF0755 protein
LESDPTVIKAVNLAYPDSVIRRVLYDHLNYDSPFNTYKYEGLPPGPLLIPSQQAVNAVLSYENHDYFFMVASVERPGFHEFSRANELGRHNRLALKYHQYLNRRGVK